MIDASGKVDVGKSVRIVRPGDPPPNTNNGRPSFWGISMSEKKSKKKRSNRGGPNNQYSIVQHGRADDWSSDETVSDSSDEISSWQPSGFVPPIPPSPPFGRRSTRIGREPVSSEIETRVNDNSTQNFNNLALNTEPLPVGEGDVFNRNIKDNKHEGLEDLDPAQMLARLQQEIADLKKANTALRYERSPPIPSAWVTVHRVRCQDQVDPAIYADMPYWRRYTNDVIHMEGDKPISNLGLFKTQQADKAFLVFRDYSCDGHLRKTGSRTHETREEEEQWMKTNPTPVKVTMSIVHYRLRFLLNQLSSHASPYWAWPSFSDDEFDPPDRLMYHEAPKIEERINTFQEPDQKLLRLFRDFVASYYRDQSDRASANFEAGCFSIADLDHLFIPGHVTVKAIDGYECGFIQTSPLYMGREDKVDENGYLPSAEFSV
ncbi:hypothetical protein BDV96DRAFT_209396 [Lophiotrema nucula]|uniref:Uncharacterized protein n=1 Tax=Lophiotrema nucula TaxID=690887 RepID=A0A6A5ZQA3_9PLEO|nr:hypothetical protein BDV96DRAFT_209396 [Lophiotrema nucula]